jgi:hypothetical protein
MVGKKGRSGRPRGRLSFTPTAEAGHHTNNYLVAWLAGVPIGAAGHYLPLPNTERLTAPKEIRRELAVLAVEILSAVHLAADDGWKKPNINHVIAWTYRHPSHVLRRMRRHLLDAKARSELWERRGVAAPSSEK